jgi:hypothetical protein
METKGDELTPEVADMQVGPWELTVGPGDRLVILAPQGNEIDLSPICVGRHRDRGFEPWFVPYQLGGVFRGARELYAWCPFEDFRDYYDVLRAERPIRFSFSFGDPDHRGDAELNWIDIEALAEPPGEGAAE